MEVSFQYFNGYSERLFSFVNNIHTKEGGTHVAGFRAALTKCINRYASDDIVPKNLREKLGGDDVREGLTCIVSVRVPNPQFEGQTKTKLGNSEVKSIVEIDLQRKTHPLSRAESPGSEKNSDQGGRCRQGARGGPAGAGSFPQKGNGHRSSDGGKTGRMPGKKSRQT